MNPKLMFSKSCKFGCCNSTNIDEICCEASLLMKMHFEFNEKTKKISGGAIAGIVIGYEKTTY